MRSVTSILCQGVDTVLPDARTSHGSRCTRHHASVEMLEHLAPHGAVVFAPATDPTISPFGDCGRFGGWPRREGYSYRSSRIHWTVHTEYVRQRCTTCQNELVSPRT